MVHSGQSEHLSAEPLHNVTVEIGDYKIETRGVQCISTSFRTRSSRIYTRQEHYVQAVEFELQNQVEKN